jgi:hypothetical protein
MLIFISSTRSMGLGGNGGISPKDSSRFMNWAVFSRVVEGGFMLVQKKNFRMVGIEGGCGHLCLRFKYLRCALHHFLANHHLTQR